MHWLSSTLQHVHKMKRHKKSSESMKLIRIIGCQYPVLIEKIKIKHWMFNEYRVEFDDGAEAGYINLDDVDGVENILLEE